MGEGCNEDLLVWPLIADGAYSVWSAYHFLASAKANNSPSSSIGIELQSVWKKIWKIRAPNKVKHFIWCASKDSLLTKQNLQTRLVPIDETCD